MLTAETPPVPFRCGSMPVANSEQLQAMRDGLARLAAQGIKAINE